MDARRFRPRALSRTARRRPSPSFSAAGLHRCDARSAGLGVATSLNGTASSELILGQRGADRLNGRGGSDCIFGGPGRDRIKARDGERDVVNCGRGRDRVRADAVDVLRRCERRR